MEQTIAVRDVKVGDTIVDVDGDEHEVADVKKYQTLIALRLTSGDIVIRNPLDTVSVLTNRG